MKVSLLIVHDAVDDSSRMLPLGCQHPLYPRTEEPSRRTEQRSQVTYNAYILDQAAECRLKHDLPELSGFFAIGPDGTLYHRA